ncbi:MAG: hypothetical protein WD512_00965 [Candidatus Paceibacterota bacterium]
MDKSDKGELIFEEIVINTRLEKCSACDTDILPRYLRINVKNISFIKTVEQTRVPIKTPTSIKVGGAIYGGSGMGSGMRVNTIERVPPHLSNLCEMFS